MISFDAITKQLVNSDVLKQLGQTVDAKPSQVKKAAKLGLPTLIEALNRNTNNQKGADALSAALDQHADVDIDDIAGFMKNVDTEDGAKILEHVFGKNNEQVQSRLAEKTGMSASQIGGLLVQFAPLILSFLGKKKEEEQLDSAGVSGLTSTLSGLFGGGQSQSSGLLGVASSVLGSDQGGNLLSGLGNLFK